ncbi:MAG: amino acid adenylation domain-containing protein [Bacillota bacterium]|nr:amino acid adenylation domain-containing protein [Bacillota bacterium]
MTAYEHPAQACFPLSQSQKNIWKLECAFPGTPINNIGTTIKIQGRIDTGLLQESLGAVISSDDALRTRICLVGGQPMQYHAAPSPESFDILDFSLADSEGLEHWEALVTREPLPVLDAPLFRFYIFRTGPQSGGVLVKVHHLISDGWAQVLLCNRIAQTYLELLSGKKPSLEPSPPYRLHVEEEQAYQDSPASKKDEAWWTAQLEKDFYPATVREGKSAVTSPIGQRRSFRLPELLNRAVYSFCLKNRVAPFSVFYMALAIYLKRMGGNPCFSVGVPIFNRASFRDKNTTGMFVSTLPFIHELDEEWTFTEFNRQLAENWLELLRHQRTSFERIETLARQRRPQGDPLFRLALSYQNSRIFESDDASVHFSGRWHYSGYQSEQLCIHISDLTDHRRYAIDYDYLTQLFSEQEIEQLHRSVTGILMEALGEPDKPIRRLSVLGKAEKEQVLYTFNRSSRPLSYISPYQEFLKQAEAHPTRAAAICAGKRWNYRDLASQGSAFARAIEGRLPGGGNLAAVLLPRSPALLAAIAGIMESGNAWLLLPGNLPERRLREILEESGAGLVIAGQEALKAYPFLGSLLPFIDAGALPEGSGDAPEYYVPRPEDTAYVVSTSGSTGKPKCVDIGQQSLLNFARAMRPFYGRGAVLSLCNVSFDAFLIESVAALLNGRTIVLAEEEEQEDPRRLAELIQRYGASFLSTTPSRLSALLREPAFAGAMSGMEALICGGEAFPSELLHRLKELTSARIYNQYGPSETTVGVSARLLNDCQEITVGAPMDNCRLYVLDSYLEPLPVGARGELCIGGVCVGKGYRNQPELTEKHFLDSPFEPGERLYRSGDLACWTPEGEIVLAGRKDRQIKLRGLRVELSEIAACLKEHPRVEDAAVRLFDHEGSPLIAAFYTADRELPEGELLSFLAAALPHYMVPACIRRIPAIPLTANGKVDEAALPRPELPQGKALPESPLEERLLAMVRESLGRPDMGADADYFLSGGDSLSAMDTLAKIEEAWGLRLHVADLYACRSVQRLAALVAQRRGDEAGEEGSAPPENAAIASAPELDGYPLSPPQQSIYVQSRINDGGMAYHMPGAFRIKGPVDPQRLEEAFRALVASEEVLRTAFVMEEGRVVQKIRKYAGFSLPVLTAGDLEEAREKFLAPFSLETPPLLRAALWQEGPEAWVLLVDTHHIISDGVSTPLILRRLALAYEGKALPPPRTRYRDYVLWLQSRPEEDMEPHRRYWKEALSPLPETLELPADLPRPHSFDFKGDLLSFSLSRELSAGCDAYCRSRGVSSYMFFAGLFALLLSRLAGQEQLLLGTPVSGRVRPELWELCGLFINTLPLKLSPRKDLSFREYIESVREQVVGMLDHQELPLEELLQLLEVPRSLSHNPLFQVLFSMRPMDASELSLGGLPVSYLPFPTDTAKMDLYLEAAKEGELYSFQLEYATSLFEKETAALWCRCYEALLREVLKDDSRELRDYDALSPADRFCLIDRPCRTRLPYVDLPLDVLADQTALRMPEETAVFFRDRTLSYDELRRRSDALAAWLLQSGAKPGQPVAFTGRRSPDLLAAMLGILKAGCAYLPVSPDFPEKRIRFMTEKAGVKFFLCDEETRPGLPALPGVAAVTIEEAAGAGLPFTPPEGRSSQDLIHVLYTSGSTGEPKGAALPHQALSNLMAAMEPILDLAGGPVLATTNLIFDTSITETLLALAHGKPLVLADDEEAMLPWRLAELIRRHGVRMAQFTPSRIQVCIEEKSFAAALKELDLILLAGEAISPLLLQRLKALTDAAVYNLYGPCEAAVYVTAGPLSGGKPVVLGRPLPNCRIYVMDEEGRPVLPTAVGEYYIAGECLAQGYLNDPERTRGAFLPDPFFPGQRMYRSGDIGRLKANGDYEFLCRRDHQIKLHGQRVELDEINGQILRSGLVGQSATLAAPIREGLWEIRAFVTPPPEGGPVDMEGLLGFLRKELPSYMVPSHILSLQALPYLPNAKLDRLSLLALDPKAEGSKAASPEASGGEKGSGPSEEADAARASGIESPAAESPGNPADVMVQIWRRVLEREHIDLHRPFFDQGGSSLLAMGVLSYYFNSGLTMTLAQFYEHPTLAEQIELLAGAAPAESPIPASAGEPSPASSLPLPARPPKPTCIAGDSFGGQALLTGATGFLGAHLVRSLLDSGVSTVLCLTRDGSEERLLNILARFFGDIWARSHRHRLHVVRGDVGCPGLALSPEAYRALAEETDMVLHAAADVRHYARDSGLVDTNQLGTAHIIDFARAAGAPLNHVSTISVSGEYLKAAPSARVLFSEEDFHIGQNWEDNAYVKGKFLGEARVYQAMEQGLPARVFRLGRLVGRSNDGVFQHNPESNSFFQLIRGLQLLGAMPASVSQYSVDLTPVDVCADALCALLKDPGPVFHLYDPAPPSLEELARLLVPELQVLSDEEFGRLLSSRLQTGDMTALSTVTEMWNRIRTTPASIHPVRTRTEEALRAAGFRWPQTQPLTLLREFTPAPAVRAAGERR